ncbi:MAG TPA: DNA translocase FtsK [Turneriella sp.]|nr:DNA translocase FtsK [Turneriella sp.]
MLKWLKPDSSNSAVPGSSRPPWIQKISVPAGQQANPEGELVWKSRLAEKLRALQPQNPQPTGVAGESDGRDFAFHVMPLDIFNASAPALFRQPPPAEPKRQAETHVNEEIETPAPAEVPQQNPVLQKQEQGGVQPNAHLEYRLAANEARQTVDTPYELSYSTIDYEKGDEFDLDALFENFGGSASQAWNPPEDAIEAIAENAKQQAAAVSPKPRRQSVRFFEPSVEVEPGAQKGASAADFDDEPAALADEPEQQAVVVQPQKIERAEKAVIAPAKRTVEEDSVSRGNELDSAQRDSLGDRASVTPRVVVNRQQELRFPLLKTQRKALEFANPAEAQSVIERLEETLEQFSIEGHVVGIQRGPIITRYELKMAAGIKVSRILALTDELAMALEAMRVRIEAPIPGRSTVGIEIPNKQRIKVLLGDILNDVGYREFSGALPLPLGRDIAGNLLLEDLTRMPHLLIAGATGSGKSVAVNSFISSLILHKTPEEVRFLLVDPKLVELSGYNDIPHLLHPVITEPNKAILALNWAVEEMERRYEDLAEMSARDIRSYNEKIRSQKNKAESPLMPYIVILIDELGDLMMVAGKEVESSIIRLAQKARAVGIHLILATQRPSVDVITALIKANCPARIALQVAQKTDSRTILDGNGAEQLLGQGDMLFRHPSKGQLIRAQVPLIEDNEVEDVVAYAKKLARPAYITLEDPKGKMGELEAGDEELFEEAWQIIVESQKASASYLQRRLRIGYNKAARLIEAFEARGMIGPQIGSKPREIIGGTGQGVQARVT